MLREILENDVSPKSRRCEYWKKFLDDLENEIREFCERGFHSSEILANLRKVGFKGSLDLLTDWLDAKGLRQKIRRTKA